jgi:hypothetical protein
MAWELCAKRRAEIKHSGPPSTRRTSEDPPNVNFREGPRLLTEPTFPIERGNVLVHDAQL